MSNMKIKRRRRFYRCKFNIWSLLMRLLTFTVLVTPSLLLGERDSHGGSPNQNVSYEFFNNSSAQAWYLNSRGLEEKLASMCKAGLILRWVPTYFFKPEERFVTAAVYFSTLIYLCIGASIGTDRIMAAIEVITSKDMNAAANKKKKLSWNPTVANLTLMAIGASLPEILLTILEIFPNYEYGELGPGTIIGSAAYNMLIILAVCIMSIPKRQTRRVERMDLLLLTFAFGWFGYLWMLLIMTVITPGRVDMWEGLVLLALFPINVCFAYALENSVWCFKSRPKIVSGRNAARRFTFEEDNKQMVSEVVNVEFKDVIALLRRQNPNADRDELTTLAYHFLLNQGHKSRAFYHCQAIRKYLTGGNFQNSALQRAETEVRDVKQHYHYYDDIDIDTTVSMVFEGEIVIMFKSESYTVQEDCGDAELTVVRRGRFDIVTTVEYYTQDGTALDGNDYIAKSGKVIFPPGIEERHIRIPIIDDDIYEMDEYFFVHLQNPSAPAILLTPSIATVVIIDNDHCGEFSFDRPIYKYEDEDLLIKVPLRRISGARARVVVPYWTVDGTAKKGKHYVYVESTLVYESDEVIKFIEINIIEEDSYQKNIYFYINLGLPYVDPADPLGSRIAIAEAKLPTQLTEEDELLLMGRPKLGEIPRIEVHIVESEEFKMIVDKLVEKANLTTILATSTWKEQFIDALTVNTGDEEGDEGEEDSDGTPGCGDYIMHFLTLFWKILFAFIPPTDIMNGYLSFIIGLIMIGIISALLGDVAMHFGCTLGILDSVSGIIFVAVGTSMPDTFASKVAAVHDDTADNSVGNVTGSNAVNVYLGIGLAWSLATIYHTWHGTVFKVAQGSISFSVMLFLIEAILAIGLLLYRRKESIGGELGGPMRLRYWHSGFLAFLYFFYITISTLEAYGIIKGF